MAGGRGTTTEDDMEEIQKRVIDRFHHFVGYYVVGAFGYTKMTALLKENKGSSVWDHLTIDDLVNSILIVKNHEDSWLHNFYVKRMPREE